MNDSPATGHRLLLLPGWLDSSAGHWQSRWQALHGCERVEQSDWLWPKRGDWMARLDEVEQASAQPTVLIAHSLGCHLVAAWAAHSQHTGTVRAALLVAPPDIERADMPPNFAGWRVPARQRLPFRALVVSSHDDPYGAPDCTARLAADWGALVTRIGNRGHINDSSGLGDWPAGWALVDSLLR